MKKKLFLILLTIFMIVLVSCNEDEPIQTEPSSEAETEAEAQSLTLVADGDAQYAVILPVESTGPMREAVNSFADKLSGLYGVKFEVKKNKNLAGGKRLLMVGVPEDDSYTEYFADVPYGEYAVKITDDGNIVVAAWSIDAIGNACTKLFLKLQNAYGAGDTLGTINDEILIKGKDTALLDCAVPHFSLTKMPRIFHVSGVHGAYELLYKNTDVAEYDAYRKTLSDSGFECLQEYSKESNTFSVYRKDGVEVTVDYFGKTKEFAVIIDKPKYEAPFTPASITAVTVPKLIEPGLEYDGALKGMCYVLQASDGSFVIIDSGDSDPKFLGRLYEVLKENVTDGSKPHIRAWFVTHAHGDHMSGVADIASSKYAAMIKCDAVYSNMPYEGYQTAYDNSTYASRVSKLEKAAKTFGADYVTARTGQTYYFADIEITILGSVDDMFLTEFADLDETSIVMTASVAGKKILFTGDAGPSVIGQYIMKRYGAETLKSDICQAMSHGTNNSAFTDFYKAVDPDIYLWCANTEFYNKHTPNKYIQSDKSAEIVYSYNGKYTIMLDK
ncbi:MAG: MBL fold metallo-hydrolase [Clostridia bacterium]|nr:MBL fold metallo-hydrolase [Clostridia bacterium]